MTLRRIACACCGAPLALPFVPRRPKLCEDCASGRPPKARSKTGRQTWLIDGGDFPLIPGETGKDGAA